MKVQEQSAALCRVFSELPPYQQGHTLVYVRQEQGEDCVLTVCRTGAAPAQRSVRLSLSDREGEVLLRFLWENAVRPEDLRAIVTDLCPQAVGQERKAAEN